MQLEEILVGGRAVSDEEFEAAHQHWCLSILCHLGDSKRIWDPRNADEIEDARESFNRMRSKNFLIFRVDAKTNEKGEQMTEFDPQAGKMIAAPQMQGG